LNGNKHKRKKTSDSVGKSTDNIRYGKRIFKYDNDEEDDEDDDIIIGINSKKKNTVSEKNVQSSDVQKSSNKSKKKKRASKGNDKKEKKEKHDSEEIRAKKKKRRKIILILLLIIVISLLISFFVSLYKWNRIMKDVITCQNSIMYDSTGNVIAVLGDGRIQENVKLDKVPKNLINAYVSIEDKNFYKHHGISVKRTVGAIGNYITHGGNGSYGGSTITQQLIKNITGENETKISRKVVEWDRAIKTEMVLSKDEIMQTYLNVIYVGPNIYGVQMGSRYYFDKDVTELDLAECAFLAGINNSPKSYNPFGETDNSEKIKTRSKTVLGVMLQEKYISQDDYNQAVKEIDEGLKFKKGNVKSKGDNVHSYMVDATISEIINDLQKKKKMSESFATNYLYYAGLHIYCTQNSDIQNDLEEEFSKQKYMIRSSQNPQATAQAAMIVIDHETGQVKGCVRWIR
jgi:penicillin-binding protein 1A